MYFPTLVRAFQLQPELSNFILSNFTSNFPTKNFPTSRFLQMLFPTTRIPLIRTEHLLGAELNVSIFAELLLWCRNEIGAEINPCRTSLNFEKLVPKFLCRSSPVPKFVYPIYNPRKS